MKVKLDNICEIQAGGTPNRQVTDYWYGGKIPWVKISDFVGKYLKRTQEHITEKGLQNSSAKVFSKGTVLFSIFASLGEVTILDIDAATNQAIAGLRIIDNDVDHEFFYYFLVSQKSNVTQLGRGVAQNNINLKILRNLEIELPNKEEQKLIAQKLDRVSQLIDKRKKQLEKIDLLVKSKFIDMFGNPRINEKKFATKKLIDTFTLSAGGTPKTDKKEYWENGTISWIGSNMCQNKILYENDGKFITELGLSNSAAKIFDRDTILIALVGATIGKTALLKFPTATNQNVLGVQNIVRAGYNPYFVFYYMQGLYDKFINLGGGKFKMANKAFVGNLDIIDVDLQLQNVFAEFAKKTDKLKLNISESLEKLETLKKSLMQKYFG